MTTQPTTAPTRRSPGPFSCTLDRDGCDDIFYINGADDTSVAQVVFWDSDDGWAARAAANARLLTAAPDLLDALKALLAARPYRNANKHNVAVVNALAAIAKAEGRPS